MKRELSSVGSERLPYKQRVGGSTPSAPTTRKGKSSFIMLFNSIDFAIFLPVVTILYWTVFTKGGG